MRHGLPILLFALAAPLGVPPAGAENTRVDVELMIAVDVSRSMTERELEIQRRGYAEALNSDEVIDAIRWGQLGQIALAYVEWAGQHSQNVVIDWTLIRGRAEAEAFAARLTANFVNNMRRTSISGAIDYGAASIRRNGYDGLRQVIDISGDGPNNQGRPVEAARDEAVAIGIEINGLPLMTHEGMGTQWHLDDLDEYYRHCVIGGPAAFVVPVLHWSDFPQAVKRKLVLELVGRQPPDADGTAGIRKAATDYDCLIGERIWNDLMDGWN